MKGKHHRPGQIIGLLRHAELDLGNASSVAQVCQKLERVG
jgi:hypothetical protein